MGIKRSTFYYQIKDNLNKERKETVIKDRIATISYQHPYYGYRRMTAQLRREKVRINHKRVLRMMRELGIQGKIKRQYITTTNSKHNNKIYPNLLKDKMVTGINQIWCADITYIKILNGFVYLAAVIGVYSRRIVVYALGKTLCPKLTITALKMAIVTRNVKSLIYHSDQSIQPVCQDYVELLKEHGIRISMSAKGTPYDNVLIESFFKTLKQEEVYLQEYEGRYKAVYRLEEIDPDIQALAEGMGLSELKLKTKIPFSVYNQK